MFAEVVITSRCFEIGALDTIWGPSFGDRASLLFFADGLPDFPDLPDLPDLTPFMYLTTCRYIDKEVEQDRS